MIEPKILDNYFRRAPERNKKTKFNVGYKNDHFCWTQRIFYKMCLLLNTNQMHKLGNLPANFYNQNKINTCIMDISEEGNSLIHQWRISGQFS